MDLKDFMNACEKRLGRVEKLVNNPLQLESELKELEEFLRIEWPNAIVEIKEVVLESEYKEKIAIICDRIKRLEQNTKTRVSFFDGIENFMQQSDKR